MTESTFDNLWQTIVLPAGTRLTDGKKAVFNPDKRRDLRTEYDQNRSNLRKAMKDPEKRIDRHKVASCLTFAIIRHTPISFTVGPGTDLREALLNEALAIVSGLKVVTAFILSDPNCSDAKKDIFKKNRIREALILENNENYVEYMARSLARMRLNALRPDQEHLMLMAHVYFYIEWHHQCAHLD
jgi:hypothetical protein